MASSVSASTLAGRLGDGWRGRDPVLAPALAHELRAQVIDGRLPVRARLPSERSLAAALGVSRGTVGRAYDELTRTGFLRRTQGAGSWTALPDGARPGVGLRVTLPGGVAPDVVNLSVAAPPAPEGLAAAAAFALDELPRHTAGMGYGAAGIDDLRQAVAERFSARGLPTRPGQVMVCGGAQHGLHLVLGLLCKPGDRVLVDDPGYPRTLTAIAAARCRPVAVPLTPDGWDADAWEHAIRHTRPALAVTVADFHNPTGRTMPAETRARIVAACARAGTTLVIDETNAELRLDGPPLPPPVATFERGPTVITVGSLSKASWGGLRVGWVRASGRAVGELAAVRADQDAASPILEQLVATQLVRDLDAALPARHRLLAQRRDALIGAVARHAPHWTARMPHGGLCTWWDLGRAVSSSLCEAALGAGIHVTPGSAFTAGTTGERFLRLPYVLAEDELEDAVARLAALEEGLVPIDAARPSRRAALDAV